MFPICNSLISAWHWGNSSLTHYLDIHIKDGSKIDYCAPVRVCNNTSSVS